MTPEQSAALEAAVTAFGGDVAAMQAGIQERHLTRGLTQLFASFAGAIQVQNVNWEKIDACLQQPLNPSINPERVKRMVKEYIEARRVARDFSGLMRGLLMVYLAERDKSI